MAEAEITGSAEKCARLVERLESDFPEVKFIHRAKRFSYRLKNGQPTVFLGEPCLNFGLLALHELGHALCGHKDYIVDVSRIKIESGAWERAKTVYLEYQKDAEIRELLPEWDEGFVQEKLDTYRDWLHAKSRCKKCGLTRYQTKDRKYHCPRCEAFVLAKR